MRCVQRKLSKQLFASLLLPQLILYNALDERYYLCFRY